MSRTALPCFVCVTVPAFVAACSSNAPNPRSGYRLRISLGARFDSTSLSGARVVLDALPQGPALGLQAGPGESVVVSGITVTSLRTDADADGEVEVVYSVTQNPWAARARFDLPLRSPGYATRPFLLRIDALGSSGSLGSVTVDRTPDGRALDFDLADPVDIPVAIPCVEGRSCRAFYDGGVSADAGWDAGQTATDAGVSLPTTRLAVAHDPGGTGTDTTVSLFTPGSDGGSLATLSTATRIIRFAWSADAQTLFVLRDVTGANELVALALADAGAEALLATPGLMALSVPRAGTAVAVGASPEDAGTRWHVRDTRSDAGGMPSRDIDAVCCAPAAFSADGREVSIPVPHDGGVALTAFGAGQTDVRPIATFARLSSQTYSPLPAPASGQLAVVGTRPGETKAALYLASTQGAPLVRVSPDPMAGEVRDIAFSASGTRLGMRGDLDTAGAIELFVAEPALRNVSGGMAPDGGGVRAWAFDPADETRIAFTADKRSAGIAELYLTGATGIPRRLSADEAAGSGGVSTFAFNPAGTHLAYITALGRLFVVEPSAAPIALGTAIAFAWSPDGAWLAVVRGTELHLVSRGAETSLGPVATGLRATQIAWAPR